MTCDQKQKTYKNNQLKICSLLAHSVRIQIL